MRYILITQIAILRSSFLISLSIKWLHFALEFALNDPDRQRRKQAEFLIKNHVPIDAVDEIFVYDGKMKQVVEELISKQKVNLKVTVPDQDLWPKVFYKGY